MPMKKIEFDLCEEIRDYFRLTPYMPIVEWAEKNIDFSADTGAERNYFDISFL